MDIFFYNLLFWGCFHISALQTEKENLYINKQKSKWENAKQSCGDNKLAGGEEMKSCQPHNCDFTQLQTIHGLRDDRDILWLDGYLLRSPLLQYEDCYKGEWIFLKTNIRTKTTFVENSVYECSSYCMLDGKAISGRYMYLQDINCYCVSEEDHEFWIDQNTTSISATADCKVKCPGRRIDRCGGDETNENTVVGFYSVYRFKLEDVTVTGIREVGQLCPSINNKGNVMYSNCRDKLLFNCQKMIASAARHVRAFNKCNNMSTSWYDAESTCSIQGGHIDTTTTTFCDETNSVENTANWHGSVIIEKIIWNTNSIPTRVHQRSLDYVSSIPTDAKCLALSVRKNHEFKLLALDCSESYYQLCIYGNALLYVSLTVPRSLVYKRDTLQFSCNPTSTVSSSFISDIILWKNSDSGWQQIVKISRDWSSGIITEKTVWSNKDVQNRSYITKSFISQNNLAGLQFVISADSVQYTDEGEYRCSIQGSVAPDLKLDNISATKFVEITVHSMGNDTSFSDVSTVVSGNILLLAILPAVFVGLLVTAVLITWFCRKRQAKSQHKTVIVRTPIVTEHHGITTTTIPTEEHEITFTPIPTGQHSYYDVVDYSKFDHSPRLTSEIQDVGEYAIPDELNMSCSAVEEHDDNSHCLDSTDYDGYLNPYQALTGQREDNSSHTYESTNQPTEYANTGIDTSCDPIDKDHDNTYEQLEEDRSNDHHGYAPIRLNN